MAASPQPHNRRRDLVGLALGFIPVLMVWPYAALYGALRIYGVGGYVLFGGIILYVVSIIAMIVCLFIGSLRSVGYGLLTMVFVSPIIGVTGCQMIINAAHL